MVSTRYRVLRPIETGGEGDVFLAEDRHREGRLVALKRLHDDVDVTVLSKEFDTLRQLSHPHVADVFDFGTEADGPYLVEAFVDGQQLGEAVVGGSTASRGRVLIQLLRALEYVHARGVVHGDVKPSNVLVELVDGVPSVRLIDFGLAGHIGEASGRASGTAGYIAPERIRGEALSPQADLYSFGITAFEILTGVHPFDNQDAGALIRAHLETMPAIPSACNPALPPTVDAVLQSLLEKSPDERPASARETLDRLSSALGMDLESETAETLKGYLCSGEVVGRSAHLETARHWVRAFAEEAAQHPVFCVWWTGADGSGRSRLLQEIGGEAKVAGLRVVHAGAVYGDSFAPIRAWLRGVGVDHDPMEKARDHFDAIEGAVEALVAAARQRPTLYLLDDANEADALTVQTLRVLIDQLGAIQSVALDPQNGPRLGLFISSRSNAGAMDVATAPHVIEQDLQPLTEDEMASWLQHLLPIAGALPDAFLQGVYRLTEGLPGHVVTVLGAMVERGTLRVESGCLQVDPEALDGPMPDSIRDALLIREEGLELSVRALLELLRVLGKPAPTSILSALLPDHDDAQLEHDLNALRDRQLIGLTVEVSQSEARYASERAGISLPDERRRELHTQIANTLLAQLEQRGVDGFGLSVVARHSHEAVCLGETKLAARGEVVACRAADEARMCHDGDVEARCLSWAVAMSSDSSVQAALRLRRAEVLRGLGRFDEAISELETLSNVSTLAEDARAQATLGLARVLHDRGDYPGALTLISTLASQQNASSAVEVLLARTQLMMGQYEAALGSVSRVIEKGIDESLLIEASDIQALVYYYTDRMDHALPSFEATRDAAERQGDLRACARAVTGMGLVLQRQGDYARAEKAYRDSLALAVQAGDRKRMAVTEMNIGTVLQVTGRTGEAADHYRASLRASRLLGDGAGTAKAASNLANLLVEHCQLSEARHWVERAAVEAARNKMGLLVAYNRAVRGMVYHGEHQLDEARKELMAAVNALRELGATGEVGETLVNLGMVARTDADTDGMRHYATAVEEQTRVSGAEKHLAWALFLRGEADRQENRSEEARAALTKALEMATERGQDALAWRCEGALARIERHCDQLDAARTHYGRALERIDLQASALSGTAQEHFLLESERATLRREATLVDTEEQELTIEAQEVHQRFMRMMEINRRLASEHNPKKLLEFILDSAVSLTGAERGFIILLPKDVEPGDLEDVELEVRVARNIDQETLRSSKSRLSHSIAKDVLIGGEPVVTVDASADGRFREMLSVHTLKLRSILCFPLKVHSKVIGVLYLDNRFQTSTFSDVDSEVLGSFSDQAAVAITNSSLHEDAQHANNELKRSHEQIAELNSRLEKRVHDQAARLEEAEKNLEQQRSQLETRYRYENIIGVSPALQRIFNVLDRVTDTDIPVLIEGESGTGKELVAKAIHYNGRRRKNRQFVSVNCAALTETLLESELFGHTKGAFTGADRDRKGLFSAADGGTLFLDEVADMPLGMQAKLLRVLQEGEFTPVGSTRVHKVDVRIVTACNRDLTAMVHEKLFRQDLFFRLNVVRVSLPALREREGDMVLLVQHFLRTAAADFGGGPPKKISEAALAQLRGYSWPGNVRELEACIMNACLFCDGDTITPAHLTHKPELTDGSSPRSTGPSGDGVLDLRGMTLAELEEKAILASLQQSGGNKVEAARQLGITRQTLYNKLKSYGIEIQLNIQRGKA